MMLFGDFGVEKCGNAEVYFIFDADMADLIANNTWTLDSVGYVCRNHSGKLQRLHRLVVENETQATIPQGLYVDHINKIKTDNRLSNLRIVTPQQSARNMPLRSNNKSGVAGVCEARGGKGYRAYITANKIRYDLGTYKTKEEAVSARITAEEHFGFSHQQTIEQVLNANEKESTT